MLMGVGAHVGMDPGVHIPMLDSRIQNLKDEH
jgi:hypothetical protein